MSARWKGGELRAEAGATFGGLSGVFRCLPLMLLVLHWRRARHHVWNSGLRL